MEKYVELNLRILWFREHIFLANNYIKCFNDTEDGIFMVD